MSSPPFGKVPWGKLMGDSVEFEDQLRLGEIVLEDDPIPEERPPSTPPWSFPSGGPTRKGRGGGGGVTGSGNISESSSQQPSSSNNNSNRLPPQVERGFSLSFKKPTQGKGRGRGAALPIPVDGEGDDFRVGDVNLPNINNKPLTPPLSAKEADDDDDQKKNNSSYFRFHGATRCYDRQNEDDEIGGIMLSESPKREIVMLRSPNKSPNKEFPGLSPPYAPHGRGTVINRSRIDSPGAKYVQLTQLNMLNKANSESSPLADSEIKTVCLKSRELVLKKVSVEKEDCKDSDDEDDIEEEKLLIDLKSTQNKLKSTTEPGSPKEKTDDVDEKKKDKELTVVYGDVQLADVPGRIFVRGMEEKKPLRKIDLMDNYDVLQRGINNCGIQDLNMLQKAVAPYVFSGSDCFIFGGKTCGKSLAYLIPLVANIITEYKLNGFALKENEVGPMALIVCKDFRSGLKIEGHVNNLLTSANKYQIFGALICDDRKETREKLEIGVDIMITTLDFATTMSKRNHNTLPMKNLQVCVFEEIDVLLRSSPGDFEVLSESIENFSLKQNSDKPFQRIFCGKDWTEDVEDLYMNLFPLPVPTVGDVPVILIQSPNQAVKYSKLKLHFHHILDDPHGEKMELVKLYKLAELLQAKELEHHLDIFVACSLPNVVRFVHEGLKTLNLDTHCAETMTMDHHELGAIKRKWKDAPKIRRVLVLHDKILRGLEVHNVTLLIHFDLPEKTPEVIAATGADRFSCMWGNFRDLTKEKRKPALVSKRKDLESHFFLTGEEPELYKLQVFGSKLNCPMPESLEKLALEMGKVHMDKKNVCPHVKLYGECSVSATEVCPFRHYFLIGELKKEPTVPRSCELELRITRCINPSQYIGQIIRLHEIEKGKRKPAVSYTNLLKTRTVELTKYYDIEENRIPVGCYAPGTLCAVQLPEGEGYARAVIERVMTRTNLNLPNTIRVFCLDTGEHLQPSAEDLLVLHEEMKKMKNLAVEINLANLQPPRNDFDYRPYHIQGARIMTTDKILIGRVRFAIGSEVWINPLVEMEIDSATKCATKKQSVRLELMRLGYAENNEYHLSRIFKLCKDTGFLCHELDDDYELEAKLPQFFQLGDDINWAYLVVNDKELEVTPFWPTYTKDPYNIFGVQAKFSAQLDELEDEVNVYAKKMISELCPNYARKFASMYGPDLMVAAYDTVDKTWRRGLIVSVREEDGNDTFDVYLTDIGQKNTHTTKQLLPLPSKLAGKMPCQAIALKLSHIRPIHEDKTNFRWTSSVKDQLTTFTVDNNDQAVPMDVVAMRSIDHPSLHCRYYEAVVLQPEGDDLGETLVANDLAEFVEGEENTAKSIRDRLLVKLNEAFDALEENDDSSDDTEDSSDEMMLGDDVQIDNEDDRWDVGGFNIDEINRILRKNGFHKPPAIENEPRRSSSENEVEAENVAAPAVPGTSADAMQSPPPPVEQPANSSATKLPLFSDLLHPTVIWKQTKSELTLSIQLPDIKEHELKVDKKLVSFRTLIPPGYGFDLEFKARLRDKPAPQVDVFGQYMRIKLQKMVKWQWPNILAKPMKLPWLKQDFEAEVEDPEDEKRLNAWKAWVEGDRFKVKKDTNVYKDNESGKSSKREQLLPFDSSDSDSDDYLDDAELGAGDGELSEAEIAELLRKMKKRENDQG